MNEENKGLVFLTDIIIGVSILFIIIFSSFYLFSTPETQKEKLYDRTNLISSDLINSFSELKVNEVQDLSPTINSLIQNESLTEDEQETSTFNLILTLWAQGEDEGNETKKELARNITNELIDSVGNYSTNINISFLVSNSTIYGNYSSVPEGKGLAVSTIVESAYSSGEPRYGYMARAYLSEVNKEGKSYLHFGGFVGQGNISSNLKMPSDASITGAYLEVYSGANFSLYIDGNFSGSFTPTTFGNFTANVKSSDINTSNLKTGNNSIEIDFTSGENMDHFIGGGFLRVTYTTSNFYETKEVGKKRYYFPGIEGIINLYDGFYVPGDLNNLSAYLHYKNNVTNGVVYLNIANSTIFESNETGEVNVSLNNSNISSSILGSGLSYNNLSKTTTPLRLGMKSTTFTEQEIGNADVVLITDVSGSMSQCVENNSDCPSGQQRIDLAKQLDKEFVDVILNITGNRVSLVSFNSDISNYTSLTDNETYLNSTIDKYTANGGTCICCPENKAYEILNSESNSSRQKFVIMMTDGIPSHKCTSSAGCEGTSSSGSFEEDCYGCTYCCPANPDTGANCDCPTSQNCGYCYWWEWYGCDSCCQDSCSCSCEMQNANFSSCRLHNDLNTTVHSVGFGPIANCQMGNKTLNAIANCGGGDYYSSQNASELQEIYRNIAQSIVSISYTTQKVRVEGDVSIGGNILYNDSYLEFNYNETEIDFGFGEFSLTLEENFTSPGNVTLDKPNNTELIEAKLTSYSGDYWSSLVTINNSQGNHTAYNLSEFGEYSKLGDPFTIHLPKQQIANGTNNITLKVGLEEGNQTLGSNDSKLVYKLKIPGYVGYGDTFNTSERAKDDAVQRLIDRIYDLTGINTSSWNITKPTEPIRGIQGIYSPSLIKVVVWKE